MLLWLWCGLAAAAPIQPLAWELPYVAGAALKQQQQQQQKKKKTMARDRKTKDAVCTYKLAQNTKAL